MTCTAGPTRVCEAAVDRLAADGYGLVGGICQYEHSWRIAYVRGLVQGVDRRSAWCRGRQANSKAMPWGGVATDFQPSYVLEAPGVTRDEPMVRLTRVPHSSIGCSRCGSAVSTICLKG